ncbi:MAG: SUF system Fe-S cluster assembly protein [Flavobacteriales bacterium]|jgi:FeS assembly SUF system protein|nr:SUF system Fe-S cluster assembly protein [Flavobacteriaceae bacterium]RZP05744.1 MAG: SUF system Fe-S cluster assembly protein [Flavobacteriales bacterium]|tara:strand:+ start:1198 stop:1524 length:327 start_codon:yes stop_codon:yes gene_type:complete
MTKQEFNPNEIGEKIIDVIKTIYDPEIPVDIYELGLIYDVLVNENFDVKILMTLTTPNCPVAETLPVDVEDKVKTINGIKSVEVEITFDPPWTQDLMSDEAKLEIGIL